MNKKFSFLLEGARAIFGCLMLTCVVGAVVHDGAVDPTIAVSPFTLAGTSRIDCFSVLPDGKILVGGAFSNLSGGVSASIARLNADGTFDAAFRGGANSRVLAIFPLSDGKILISGDFLQYDGVTRNRIARLNSDGTLDQTFAPNFGGDYVQIVAVQPDQKMIVVGTFLSVGGTPRNRIARLNPDATLDPTFVVNGGLNNSGVHETWVQPDGKIVFVGSFDSYDGNMRNGMLRLNGDGSLDAGFNPLTNGGTENEVFDLSPNPDGSMYVVGDIANANKVIRITSGGAIDPTFDTGSAETSGGQRIYAVLAQPDGKVLIGGGFDGIRVNGTMLYIRYRLFRFNSNGSVDGGFIGQAGSSFSSGDVRKFALQNGKILVGGDFPQLNGVFRGGIGRLNLDSSLDQTFLGFLAALTNVNTFHIFPDGEILIAGGFHGLGNSFRKYVAKLNADGSLDNSFQIDPAVDHDIFTVTAQPDGKLLLGGYTGDSGFGQTLGKGVWRVNSDGSLDPTLNTQIGRLEGVRSIAVQADGKIIVAGPFSEVNGVARRAIARLNVDGGLDNTFTPNVGGLSLSKVVIQPDGKILIGGSFSTINGFPIANFARLNADGSVDNSFNIGPGANNAVTAFFILPDNRIYVGGTFSSIVGVPRSSLVRLLSDGTLDTTFKPVRISSGVASIVGLTNNKILVGGTSNSIIDAAPRQKILRLRDDGVLDFSFDVSGVTFNGSAGQIYQLGVQPDGSVLAAGQFDGLNGVSRSGFARLLTFPNPTRPVFDFDGDGKTDISVFRPSENIWHLLRSYLNQYRPLQWGSEGDLLVPADFDGDFRTDIAVFRPSNGAWYWINSSDNTASIVPFGTQGDIPVPGDYDGDDKADLAIFRPSDGNWWLNRSSAGVTAQQFGITGDRPIPADYDGDRKTDIAIFRPAAAGAEWWVQRSNAGLLAMQFGSATDKAVQGDYTGDGKADVAIWRPTTGDWLIVRSEDFSFYGFPFGTNGDIPASGDYDGDGKLDATVFRPSSATWFIGRTTAGTQIVQFGSNGDRPIPNAFVP